MLLALSLQISIPQARTAPVSAHLPAIQGFTGLLEIRNLRSTPLELPFSLQRWVPVQSPLDRFLQDVFFVLAVRPAPLRRQAPLNAARPSLRYVFFSFKQRLSSLDVSFSSKGEIQRGPKQARGGSGDGDSALPLALWLDMRFQRALRGSILAFHMKRELGRGARPSSLSSA